jgi:hypothetical protein
MIAFDRCLRLFSQAVLCWFRLAGHIQVCGTLFQIDNSMKSAPKLRSEENAMKCATHVGLVCLMLSMGYAQGAAQQIAPTTANSGTSIVPQLVNFSGRALDAQGKPTVGVVGVSFAIYSEQSEGAPLWLETQNVQPDSKGNFTAQLGAATSGGMPLQLFSSGQARWLGVRVDGGEEQPRVLLLSVPYALKAADAQTLGGLPPSAFVLSPTANLVAVPSSASASASPAVSLPVAGKHTKPPVGGTGTADYIPIWTDNTGDLGNSILYQLGTGKTAKIGINITAPLATLDVAGETLIRGTLEPITKGYATATKSFFSNALDLEASSFNSTTQKASMQHFEWVAEPTRNNTSTPGATLNLLFGQDSNIPTETGIVVARNGAFSATTTDVLEAGVSGISSGFGFGVFGQGNTGVGGSGANTGVYGTSLTGTGVQGSGGVNGVAASGSAYGVTANSPGTAVYGSGVKYGVYGASNGVGVYGSATLGFGFATDSNVQQARSAGGWVKGMAVVNAISPPYNIERCFNSTLLPPAATTPPCGFNLAEDSFGVFTLDFGFEVDDRFYSTALMDASYTQGTFLRLLNIQGANTQLLIYATDNSGNGVGAEYSVVVY